MEFVRARISGSLVRLLACLQVVEFRTRCPRHRACRRQYKMPTQADWYATAARQFQQQSQQPRHRVLEPQGFGAAKCSSCPLTPELSRPAREGWVLAEAAKRARLE